MRSLLIACLLAACGVPTPEQPVAPAATPTWNADIQPLVAESCGGCHTPGGIAPFSLDTYADAKVQVGAVAAAVENRTMPPWMPSEDCMPLKNSRRLSDAQVALVTAWANAGAPEGDATAMPAPMTQPEALSWVDETLQPDTAYTPPSNVTDDYHCFILPRGDTVDREIIGLDVQPDHRQMVHHVIAYALDPMVAQQQDDAEPGEGWTCFGGPGDGAAMLGGWVPGTSAASYPDGTGVPLPAGKVVVIQVHYNLTTVAPVADRTSLELQFAKSPVAKQASWTAMADWTFNIPPNAMGYTSSSSTKLGVGGHVWGVFPHMHTLGRSINVQLDGACMINVPKWDFHWQQGFFFDQAQGQPFFSGQTVALSCTWDNTTSNNVTWGEKTSDEMCLAFFYVTP